MKGPLSEGANHAKTQGPEDNELLTKGPAFRETGGCQGSQQPDWEDLILTEKLKLVFKDVPFSIF